MSNHHEVNSLAASFVQMAKAFEDLPHVQNDLHRTQNELQKAQDTIQRLELKLMDRHQTIDSLRSDVRKAEADRDDAELRFLEADERTTKALAFIKEQFGSAGALIQSLEPPKVVVKEPETQVGVSVQANPTTVTTSDKSNYPTEAIDASASPVESKSAEGQSVSPLPDAAKTADHSAPMPDGQTSLTEPVQKADTATTEPSWASPQGKSDGPFTATTPQVDIGPVVSPVVPNALSENGTPEPKADGPYVGKRYENWPYYVNLANWLAGGGTEADYHWRP